MSDPLPDEQDNRGLGQVDLWCGLRTKTEVGERTLLRSFGTRIGIAEEGVKDGLYNTYGTQKEQGDSWT